MSNLYFVYNNTSTTTPTGDGIIMTEEELIDALKHNDTLSVISLGAMTMARVATASLVPRIALSSLSREENSHEPIGGVPPANKEPR